MQRFTIARHDQYYLAWPDVTIAPDGRLVCIFSECTHHGDRSYTRFMLSDSLDRGRTWTPARPLSEPLHKPDNDHFHWNCARIVTLTDGRLAAVGDRIRGRNEGAGGDQDNFLWFSSDNGATWTDPQMTPAKGIVPDQLIELRHGPHAGRWLLGAHTVMLGPDGERRDWYQRVWTSDDQGATWAGPFTIATVPGLKLCEGSMLQLADGHIVCLMRENSGLGLDAFKAVSADGGQTWGEVTKFPLPACHRPVLGQLANGQILITHRFMQGGKGWVGSWTQNTFAAITSAESLLATARGGAAVRILPLDFDRSSHSDTGYTGHVQFPDGEIYIVNYIMDDWPRGQIRGYSLHMSDFLLPD